MTPPKDQQTESPCVKVSRERESERMSTTMTLQEATRKRGYRIPKVKDVVIQKKKSGTKLTKSQQAFWDQLLVNEHKRVSEIRKVQSRKWLRLVNLTRMTNEYYWAEEGEIL